MPASARRHGGISASRQWCRRPALHGSDFGLRWRFLRPPCCEAADLAFPRIMANSDAPVRCADAENLGRITPRDDDIARSRLASTQLCVRFLVELRQRGPPISMPPYGSSHRRCWGSPAWTRRGSSANELSRSCPLGTPTSARQLKKQLRSTRDDAAEPWCRAERWACSTRRHPTTPGSRSGQRLTSAAGRRRPEREKLRARSHGLRTSCFPAYSPTPVEISNGISTASVLS